MSFLYTDNTQISYRDSQQLSTFGHLRTTTPRLLGEYRFMFGSGTTHEMNDKVVGAGSAIVTDHDNLQSRLSIGTETSAFAARQTKQYHPYIVGTSNLCVLTFLLDERKQNLNQSVGMFDDSNGIFFRMRNDVPEFVIRRNGIDVETVSQENWNVDNMDGSGDADNPSGIEIDFSRTQILCLDYLWLGAGRVRIGFGIRNQFHVCHIFYHANESGEPYILQPSLPCRWEIQNTGTTASESTLTMICASVYSEGAIEETGFNRSVSTDGVIHTLTTGNTGNLGILAVRLKNTLVGKQNKSFARLKNFNIFSSVDANYKIVILNDASKVASATWNPVPGYSWCEYSTNLLLNSGWATDNEYKVLVDGFSVGAQGANNSGVSTIFRSENRTSCIYQNYDSTDSQIFVIVGYRVNANADMKASLEWIEVK